MNTTIQRLRQRLASIVIGSSDPLPNAALAAPGSSGEVSDKNHVHKKTFIGFSSHLNTDQLGITTNTLVVIVFDTEHFDTEGDYDNTTGRYTPSTPGYYLVNAGLTIDELDSGKSVNVRILKNSTLYFGSIRSMSSATDINLGSAISRTIYMNGTTDFLEIVGWHDSGVDEAFNGDDKHPTYFDASWQGS